MFTGFQPNAFQPNAFQIAEPVPSTAPVVDEGIGGGGFWDWKPSHKRGERWKKRRAQLDRIDRLLAGIDDQVPDDVSEAQPIKTAKAAVAKVERVLAEPPGPSFDWQAVAQAFKELQSALKSAEKALVAYQIKLEDDDDDDLLMMS